MKIYIKTGDKGTTGLFSGERVSKASLRVDTYGTADELNSIIGIALSHDIDKNFREDLMKINKMLFRLGSDLATPPDAGTQFKVLRIEEKDISWLEKKIDEYTGRMPELKNFILPGGSLPAAFLHQARTVCRRAERMSVRLAETENTGELPVVFLNRLSDYLFTAARYANHLAGIEDIKWLGD